ncbi:MAG: hypothetical protein ABI689_12650 [Thermoanaerobaculia bacterium]
MKSATAPSRIAQVLALTLALVAARAEASQQVFTGSGAAGVATAIAAFRAAIGGAENGGGPPAASGFRTINWDAVALDGTDFGGNSKVISPGAVVGIPVNRFDARGVTFAEVYAVAGDGFASVNPHVAGQFPAFSPAKTFAMFNEPSIELSINVPGNSLTPAATRGFGVVFIDVERSNSSSLELLRGSESLGKFFAPAGGNGQPSFIGVLLDSPRATHVEIIPGDAQVFDFEHGVVSPNGTDNAGAGHDLVVTDDFIYPEPVADLTAPCVPSDSILCLDDHAGDHRFRTTVKFATVQGGGKSGVGKAIELSSLGVNHGGLFWFFSADNPELLVKIVNACGFNDDYWIYASAGTNVGFSLSLVDTELGNQALYSNPDLTPALPIQDTGTPLTCH